MSIEPGARLGRRLIRAKIGEGGMDELYLAHDPELDRKVALKILSAEVAAKSDRMKRFVREPTLTRVMKSAQRQSRWTHGLKRVVIQINRSI